jgi:hypothetical protein
MRFEPGLRARIFEHAPEVPYYLSMVEEVICLEAALGAYLLERVEHERSGKGMEADPKIEALLRIAKGDGLAGYAMFEILGKHRPERARAAPSEVHRAVMAYVERHVLRQGSALPEGVYTAQR